MTIKGKPQATAAATDTPDIETGLARAMILSSAIMKELRSPSEEERAQIAAAQDRAVAAGVDADAVGAMFTNYRHHLAARDEVERAQAREAAAREERERVRQHWRERPGRFKALPEAVRMLYLMEEQFMAGGTLQAADLRRAFVETRRALTSAPGERHIPVSFEPETIKAAQEAGATRDGLQGWGAE